MLIMKDQKREIMKRIELLNNENIRRLGGKENYKKFEILIAYTINKVDTREQEKTASEEQKSF